MSSEHDLEASRDAPLPRRAHLGIQFTRAGADSAQGLAVESVRAGTAAALAGVLPGDVVVSLDGARVARADDARSWLAGRSPDAPFEIEVVRGGRGLALAGRLLALPTERYAGSRVELDQVRVGGRRLRVIATVPEHPGPHRVVYFLPAAHWASEEYPFEPDHPVAALLAALAGAGYATLRVERGGVGDSDGPRCTELDFDAELTGYRAGFDWLAARSWAAPRPFVFGHSLGGMLAPLLGTAGTDGVIVFGTGVGRLRDILLGTARRRAALVGLQAGELEEFMRAIEAVVEAVIVRGKLPRDVYAERPELAAAAGAWYAGDRVFGRVAAFYQQLQQRDLASAWEGVRVPVLALHGSGDWVASAEDAARIAELAGPRASHVELASVDHFMKDLSGAGAPGLSAALVESVLGWLEARVQSSRSSSGQTQP